MILDHCTSDFELVNIQILENKKGKVFGEIELLYDALSICQELDIDIISLSSVSTILSDSKHLYGITRSLSKNTIIVSALDNRMFVTVPTSYPHIIGVISDRTQSLSPGELAYSANNPFGIDVFANCDFGFLKDHHTKPSNSYAVPVVATYINELLNKGAHKQDIWAMIRSLASCPSAYIDDMNYKAYSTQKITIPVVTLCGFDRRMCITLMDIFFEKFAVQATALSFEVDFYDVRIRDTPAFKHIDDEIRFMERHYKTDLIFIMDFENELDKALKCTHSDVDVIYRTDDEVSLIYDDMYERVSISRLPDKLHSILTA